MQYPALVLSAILLFQAPLFAHSHGDNQGFSGNNFAYQSDLMGKFREAVMSKPDVDARSFKDIKVYFRKKKEFKKFLNNFIKAQREKFRGEGISVSVISKNDLLFLRGYGYADKENKIPVTPFTFFKIGSVSKLFTGISIMQLAEKGRIDIDAPLDTYIPDFTYKTHFPDAEHDVTIRSLMTHQSGLVGNILKGAVSPEYPPDDFNTLISHFSNEYLAYPPRYISSYSNSGVALLGIVIERVSGQTFESYVKDNILNPAGMLFSNVQYKEYMSPLMAKAYSADGNEIPSLFIRDVPAGSFVSNAIEMTLFMKMILKGGTLCGKRILDNNTLDEMFKQQNCSLELDFPDDYGMKWGLSWSIYNHQLAYAGDYIGHGGAVFNYFTLLNILPEHGFAVIVQTNSETGSILSREIANMAMIKALEIFRGIKKPQPDPIPPIVPLTQEQIIQAAGTYITNYFGCISLYPKDDRLFVFSPFHGEAECIPHADGWFSLYENGMPIPDFQNLRITVKEGAYERFIGIESRDRSGTAYRGAEGMEYEIPAEHPQEWYARIGKYSLVNPDLVTLVDTPLTISLSPQNVMYCAGGIGLPNVLTPLNSYEAIRAGRGREINETIQVLEQQGDEHLYYLGYFLKKDSIKPLQESLKRNLQETPTQQSDEIKNNVKDGKKDITEEIINKFYFPGLLK